MRTTAPPRPSLRPAPAQGDRPAREFPACLRAATLQSLGPRLIHGFSGGFPREDDARFAGQVRPWLEREAGPLHGALAVMAQPHGREIADLDTLAPGPSLVLPLPDVDGACAGGRATPVLLVKSADCVPVLAVDPERGQVAALHAGWRGVAAGILPRLLARWRGQGSSLAQVRLVFGPHIRACCFAVRQDCLAHFAPDDLADAIAQRGEFTYLALETVLRGQARRAALTEDQVESLALCTDCHRSPQGETVFASYRRSGRAGERAGRNVSFIALRPDPAGTP